MTEHRNTQFLAREEEEAHLYAPTGAASPAGIAALWDINMTSDKALQALTNAKNAHWNRLHRIMRRKRRDRLASGRETTETLNVLFSGGSVCAGNNCVAMNDTFTDNNKRRVWSWCSYPRRFVEALQEALDEATERWQLKRILVSSRICCDGGSSTIIGLDNMYAHKYAAGNACGTVVDYTSPNDWSGATSTPMDAGHDTNDTGWQPELVVWDHSVNDGNAAFFSKGKPRRLTYENFIGHMVQLPNKPQVVSFDTVKYPGGGEAVGPLKEERREINSKFNVPTIDYNAFPASPNSVWYAAPMQNVHPLWPTHVVWCELLFYSIIKPVIAGLSGSGGGGSSTSSGGAASAAAAKASDDDDAPATLAETMPCSKGYSTDLDFSGELSLIQHQEGDSVRPTLVVGSWSLSSEANKRGWLYLNLNSSDAVEANALSFRCHNLTSGHISIGYYASYTREWGRGTVVVTNPSKKTLVAKEMNSHWDTPHSVKKVLEIPLPTQTLPMPFVDCTISVQKGRKFKITSIACC